MSDDNLCVERCRASGQLPINKVLLDQLRQMAGNLDETAAEPLSLALQEGAEAQGPSRSNGTSQSSQSPAEQHEPPTLTATKIEAQEDFNDPPDPPAGEHNVKGSPPWTASPTKCESQKLAVVEMMLGPASCTSSLRLIEVQWSLHGKIVPSNDELSIQPQAMGFG